VQMGVSIIIYQSETCGRLVFPADDGVGCTAISCDSAHDYFGRYRFELCWLVLQ